MKLSTSKNLFRISFVTVLGLAIGAFPSAFAQDETTAPEAIAMVPESPDAIKLPLWEWTGHRVIQTVTGEILKEMGYNVEYVNAGEIPSHPAIAAGELHASMEVWVSNQRVMFFHNTHGKGGEDLGYLGLAPGEGWYYPPYMEEQCPGLPDWQALNDCAELFSVPETFPKGRFLDYPAEWAVPNDQRLEALDINFEIVKSGGEGSLITEIESAYARKAPLLLIFWAPHWAFTKYDLKRVQLPAYQIACEEDPAWGLNKDAIFDCDLPAQEIKKYAWAGVKDKWPAAYRLMRNVRFTNADQEALMLKIDVEGGKLEKVVANWLKGHETMWRAWVKDAMLNPGS